MLPKIISISENDALVIKWDNEKSSEINKYFLRKSCPCAICEVERDDHHHDYNLFRGNKTEIIEQPKNKCNDVEVGFCNAIPPGICTISPNV